MLAVATIAAVVAAVAATWALARPRQQAVEYRVEANDAAGFVVSPEVVVTAAAPALMPEVVSTARRPGPGLTAAVRPDGTAFAD